MSKVTITVKQFKQYKIALVVNMIEEQKETDILAWENVGDSSEILITPRIAKAFLRDHELNKELNPKHLVAFSIGTTAIGYFTQWSSSIKVAGFAGIAAAFIIIALNYLVFFRVLSKFSAAFPYAGGPYAYARQGLNTLGGYLAGVASALQYICMSTFVLVLVKDYLSSNYHGINSKYFVLISYLILLAVHVLGIRVSSIFQIFLTSSMLSGLIIFSLGSSPVVTLDNLANSPLLVNGWQGILTILPTTMWFFMGLESITVSAEETTKPQRDLPSSLMVSLGLAFIFSLSVCFLGVGAVSVDRLTDAAYPLLFVLREVQGHDIVLLTTFSALILMVFFSSLLGLGNGSSRQVFALARAGYLPRLLCRTHTRGQTPYIAILIPGLLSILLTYFCSLRALIPAIIFCAVMVQILVTVSFIKVRQLKPALFPGAGYLTSTTVLGINLVISAVMLVVTLSRYYSNAWLLPVMGIGVIIYYHVFAKKNICLEAPEEVAASSLQRKVRVEIK